MLNWDEPAHPRLTAGQAPAPAPKPAPQPALGVVAAEPPAEIPEAILQDAAVTPDTIKVRETEGGATGLEDLTMGADRITVDDKQMINCRADLNQLVPFKYQWAWQKMSA